MPSNLAARRNATHLAPIQTTVTSKPRSFSTDQPGIPEHGERDLSILHVNEKPEKSPLPAPSTPEIKAAILEPVLKPRHSRSALFDLFSKSNGDRGKETSSSNAPSSLNPTVHQTQSRMLLQKPSRPTTQAGYQGVETSQPRSLLRNAKSSKDLRAAKRKDEQPKSQLRVQWRPPPLFQAYPQAVKHTSLEAQSSSSGNVTVERQPRSTTRDNIADGHESVGKGHRLLDRMRSKSRLRDEYEKGNRQPDTAEPAPSWTRKVYVLVTAGYLLQYSGDGSFDRAPEKILKLGPESAAFASDALEGKHWVLEVVQTAIPEDSGVRSSSKGFWSKIGLQPHSRREVSSMLLVFPSPEEMDAWRKAIRKLIGVDACNLASEADSQPALKRYSSIIRHSTKEPDQLSMIRATESNHSSPTIYVPSLRDSGSTVVASESSFPSRKPRQLSPTLKPEGMRPISTISTRTNQFIIGPALKSPGFFERHQTPTTAEFPKYGFDESLLHVPISPTEPEMKLSRRWSLHSASSKSSFVASDVDTSGVKQSALPYYLMPPSHRESEPSTPCTPSLQSFPEPPRKAASTNATEMEVIAESPPTSSHGIKSNNQSVDGIEEVVASSNDSGQTFTANSANQGSSMSSANSSKRTSVFTRPLSIVPQQRTSADPQTSTRLDSTLSRTPVLETPSLSPRLTDHGSDRNAAQLYIPENTKKIAPDMPSRSSSQPPFKPSQYSSRPISPSSFRAPLTSGPQDHPLRRPASLQVRSDPAPFLAAPRISTNTSASASRHIKGHSAPDDRAPDRKSQMVAGGRIRASALNLRLPPPKPPPNMPLPAPPTQPPTTTI